MSKLKSIPTFKTEAEERKVFGKPRLPRLNRLEQATLCAFPNLSPLDDGDFQFRLPLWSAGPINMIAANEARFRISRLSRCGWRRR